MPEAGPAPSRLDRRKARTRAALIGAAQTLIADGRPNAPILEITKLADIGLGSFYNHFETREALFAAAVEDALETHGAVLDQLTSDLADAAEAFATSFRITGRLHRLEPALSKVVIASGPTLITSESGLIPRMRRDLVAASEAGRFEIDDIDLAVAMIAGCAMSLGQLIHVHPDRDDAATTDRMTERLLTALGMKAAQARRLVARPLPSLETLFGSASDETSA